MAGGTQNIGMQPDTNLAEMFIYEAAMPFVINKVNTYHFITGFSVGDLAGWIFNAGSTGGGNITTANGGAAININDVGHGLVDGDHVTVQSANHDGIEEVTYVDDDNFTVPIAFVGNEAGFWQQGSYLEASIGANGKYSINYSSSLDADANNKIAKVEAILNTSEVDKTASERNYAVGDDMGTQPGTGFVTIATGDRVYLALNGQSDATDFTIEHMNINLHRL